ncbi:hypothetical protein FOA43_004369 [Brettanomyces nanus]|uniref:Uncharacterized protein n=1 Tax=Eeniella nana TaxID=13502 RepID=A0A875SA54_EENNA|nr:uncharacterized protein FOA43_004369 [Brettanomyces nanus]QPG76975.1 hypothetical protein FOA43_004369 [Brettanomyces nanus]
MQATIESIVTYLTSPEIIDYQFMVDFFLSFRNFIDSLPLLELLLCRLTWCLKRSLSDDDAIATTGKLALVRTFVALRHWILNHFQDDFLNDKQMRELLTSTINEIPNHSYFIDDDSNLQAKVIVNLKKSYIVLCHIFWNTVSLAKLSNTDLLHYNIQGYDSMPRSRISVLGLKQLSDPSARRSGILSMVEQNSSSSLNLLLKERADMIEDATNLESILQHSNQTHQIRLTRIGDIFSKEKFILHPKASLSSLGPCNLKNISRDGTLENIYSSMLQHVKSTPIQGVKPLVFGSASDEIHESTDDKENYGFSTRGKVEVFKDSGVRQIAPSTPLKKLNSRVDMDHAKSNVGSQLDSKEAFLPLSPTRVSRGTRAISTTLSQRQKRRTKFIKYLFQQKESEVMQIPSVKSSPTSKLQAIKKSPHISKTTALERTINIDGKMDILSTRVIEDYNAMKKVRAEMVEPVSGEENSIIKLQEPDASYLQESPTKKKGSTGESSINSSELLAHFNDKYGQEADNIDDSEITKESDTSAVLQNIAAESNANSKKEKEDIQKNKNEEDLTSFRTPSVTMNWSNSLDISHSTRDIVDMSLHPDAESVATDNVSTDSDKSAPVWKANLEDQEKNEPNNATTTVSIPARCDVPVADTSSVAEYQPTSPLSLLNDDTPLECSSLIEAVHTSLKGDDNIKASTSEANGEVDLNQRISVKVISRDSAVSAKSYMTYDSSLSSGIYSDQDDTASNSVKLRKKNAVVDLREGLAGSGSSSQKEGLHTQSVTPEKRVDASVDMEVISMLKELPYYEDGFDSGPTEHEASPCSNSSSTVSMIPSPAQSFLLPYPGISQTAIAELAAIPDKMIDCNPIEYARNKLRGDAKSKVPGDSKEDDSRPASNISDSRKSHKTIYMSDMGSTVSDVDGTAQPIKDSDEYSNESIDEVKLEKKVRDLFIAQNPNKLVEKEDVPSEKSMAPQLNNQEEKPLELKPEAGCRLSRKDRAKYNSTLIRHEPMRASSFDMRSLSLTPKKLMYGTQLLSVQEAMYKANHVPFVLSYDSDTLLQQFTLIERDLLLEVDWKELVDMKWDTPLIPYSSWLRLLLDHSDKSSLQMITLRFNLMTNWIISEILLCKNLNVRALTISRYIHLASSCRKRQNFATMFQIMLALTSSMIKKLKVTWSSLDAGDFLILKELKDATSPNNNFKAIREEMDTVIPSKGIIPFLALDMSDLNINSERLSILKCPVENKREEQISGAGEDDMDNANEIINNDPYELINFDKFRTRCTILKQILRLIDWSRLYMLKRNDEVLSKCLYVSSLSEEEMEYCFEHLEEA